MYSRLRWICVTLGSCPKRNSRPRVCPTCLDGSPKTRRTRTSWRHVADCRCPHTLATKPSRKTTTYACYTHSWWSLARRITATTSPSGSVWTRNKSCWNTTSGENVGGICTIISWLTSGHDRFLPCATTAHLWWRMNESTLVVENERE